MGIQVNSVTGGAIANGFSEIPFDLPPGTSVIEAVIPDPILAPGRYSLSIGIGTGDIFGSVDNLDGVIDAAAFEVAPPIDADGRIGQWQPGWGPIRYPRVGTSIRSASVLSRASE